MKDKDSNYIEIDGVKFTLTVDEEKLKHIEMMPKCEIRFDDEGKPYEVCIETEECIIKMMNGN